MITTFLSFPAIPGVDHAVLSSGMVGLIDAALRALLAATAVLAGLHLFAQATCWCKSPRGAWCWPERS